MPTKITFQSWSFALISGTLALLMLASFGVEKAIRRQLQSEIRLALEAVLKAETRGVRAWYSQQQLLAETLAKHPLISQALQQAPPVTGQALKTWLRQTPYPDFVLASSQGHILFSSRAEASQAWESVSMQAKQQALKGKSRLIETFVRVKGQEEPQLAMLTPVSLKAQVKGFLFLKLDPRRSFPSLLQGDFWGKSSETYLIDPHGVMLTPSRFESQLKSLQILAPGQSSALHLKVRNPEVNLLEFPQRTPPAKQALTPMAADLIAGRSGTRLQPYLDYRGVPVVGAWHWDKELGLGIVTEMDADEAFQSMNYTEWWLYGFTFFAFCLLLGLSRAFYKNHEQLEKVAELLIEREAHFHSIFENAQDVILIFEGETIHECNPAALSLFGYAHQDFLGLAWHAISPLYQPDGQTSLTESRGRLLETLSGKKLRFDWRFETSQGEQFNANVRLNALKIGTMSYCQATIRERLPEPT
ncbi:MAG: PAS domain-containing protein [Candidatus Sericytochromatia bacterium]